MLNRQSYGIPCARVLVLARDLTGYEAIDDATGNPSGQAIRPFPSDNELTAVTLLTKLRILNL